jgi:hypothetical protein
MQARAEGTGIILTNAMQRQDVVRPNSVSFVGC